jgi:hypothetical protein
MKGPQVPEVLWKELVDSRHHNERLANKGSDSPGGNDRNANNVCRGDNE